MTKSILRRVTATAALIAGTAGAAAAQQPQRITFDEAVSIALRQNSAITRASNAEALDQLAVSDAKLGFLPDLRLSTSGSRDINSSAGSGSQSMSARLSSSVTVFDGFANIANLRGAQLEESAGTFDTERTRQDILFAVISGYLTLIEAGEQVRVAEDNLTAEEDRVAELQVLVDRGSRPIADLYQQRASAAAARSTVVSAERLRELAEVELMQALRLDAAGEYDFVAPELTEPERDVDLDVNALVERAYLQRADLAAQATRAAAAQQDVRAARASRLPSVSLSAGYGANYSSGADLGFADQLDASQGGSVSLSVSLPLFDKQTTSHAIERANIQVDNAQLTLAEQRQQVALEVRRAVLDRQSAVAQSNAADARVEAARQALTATEARYDAGVATLFEVAQSRTAFVDATSAQVRARYTLLFQDRVLDYYTGELDVSAGLAN